MKKNIDHKMILSIVAILVVFVLAITPLAALAEDFASQGAGFTYSPEVASPPYNVTFLEKGLPTGTTWHVREQYNNRLISSNTEYVNFTGIYNGSYFFSVNTIYTITNTYTPNPSSFTIIISGNNVKQTVSFQNSTNPGSPEQFHANLSITNLPSSIPGSPQWYWSASINGITLSYSSSYTGNTADMTVTGLLNGTYSYTLSTSPNSVSGTSIYGTKLTPSAGQFTVKGKNVSLDFKFSFLQQYKLTFSETGLSPGQTLYVNIYCPETGTSLSGQSYVSSSGSVVFNVINQSYQYSISSSSALYSASPSYGTALISGASETVHVSFRYAPSEYSATFRISNPPGNLAGSYWYWSVNLNGTSLTSYNSTLTFTGLTNGTYFFYIYGYGISIEKSYGIVTVNGSAVSVSVEIQKSYTVIFRIANPYQLRTGPPDLTSELTSVSTGYTMTSSSYNGTLIFSDIPNGTYLYTLSVDLPYTVNKTSGTVVVSGSSMTVRLSATEGSVYVTQFDEKGIPITGTYWGVALDNGFTYNNSYNGGGLLTTTSALPFVTALPNGTYTVQGFIYNNGKYYFTSPQTFSVSGHIQNVTIDFAGPSTSGALPNIPAGTLMLIGIALVVILAAVNTIYLVRKKNKGGQGGNE